MVAGRTLLERAVAALTPLCREVIVTGRSEAPAPCVPDRPAPGLGPLGGICAALHHAQGRALDGVVTVPVDCLGFDDEVLAALLPGPACIASLPVAGVWPVGALPLVEAILAGPPPHSLRRLAGACGARAVTSSHPLGNFNTPADLAAWENGDE
jgi:molybdopterin-guanine dinucleotide biosynthesis protein A